MQRRSLLKAVAAGTALSPAWSLAQTACPAPAASFVLADRAHADLNEALSSLYSQSPYALLGQHMHTDIESLLFPYNDKHIQMMKDTGKKHLVVETPKGLQGVYDSIANGQLTPFILTRYLHINWLEPRVNMGVLKVIGMSLRKLKEAGISAHCCDNTLTEVSGEDLHAFTEYLKGRAPEDKAVSERILKARMDDRQRLQIILERTKGEPAVVNMGPLHFQDHQHSLKSLLRPDQYTRINLYGNEEIFEDAHRRFCSYDSEFAGILKTQQLYQTGEKSLPTARARPAGDRPDIRPS